MELAYRKECYVTLIAFGVVTLLTHLFPFYFLFPGLTQLTMFGFPAHYLLTMVIGWLVLIPVYWVYVNISENIDREIEETSERAVALEDADAYAKAQAKEAAE